MKDLNKRSTNNRPVKKTSAEFQKRTTHRGEKRYRKRPQISQYIRNKLKDFITKYDMTEGALNIQGIQIQYNFARAIFDIQGASRMASITQGLIAQDVTFQNRSYPIAYINLAQKITDQNQKISGKGVSIIPERTAYLENFRGRKVAGNFMIRQLLVLKPRVDIYNLQMEKIFGDVLIPYFIDLAGGPLQLALSKDNIQMHGSEVTNLPDLVGSIDINSIGLLIVKELDTTTPFRLLQHQLLLQNFLGFCCRYNSEKRTIIDLTFRREQFAIDEISQSSDTNPIRGELKRSLRESALDSRPAKEQFPGHDLLTTLASWTFDDYKKIHLKLTKIDQADPDSDWNAEVMRYYLAGKGPHAVTQSFLILFGAKDKDGISYEIVLINTRLGVLCDRLTPITLNGFKLKKEVWDTHNKFKGRGKISYVLKAIFKQQPDVIIKALTKYGLSASKHILNKPFNTKVLDIEAVKRQRPQVDREIIEISLRLTGEENWFPLSEFGIIKIETLPHLGFKYPLTIKLAREGFIPSFNPTEDIVEEHTGNIKRELPNPKTVSKPPFWGKEENIIVKTLRRVYQDSLQ